MVIAGIKNKNTQGAKKKNEVKSAKPAFKILKSPLKTHRNKPFNNKKTPITKQAIGLAKNELNSFFKIAINVKCLCVYLVLFISNYVDRNTIMLIRNDNESIKYQSKLVAD